MVHPFLRIEFLYLAENFSCQKRFSCLLLVFNLQSTTSHQIFFYIWFLSLPRACLSALLKQFRWKTCSSASTVAPLSLPRACLPLLLTHLRWKTSSSANTVTQFSLLRACLPVLLTQVRWKTCSSANTVAPHSLPRTDSATHPEWTCVSIISVPSKVIKHSSPLLQKRALFIYLGCLSYLGQGQHSIIQHLSVICWRWFNTSVLLTGQFVYLAILRSPSDLLSTSSLFICLHWSAAWLFNKSDLLKWPSDPNFAVFVSVQ